LTKRIQINTILKRTAAAAALILVILFGWFSIRWHFANAVGTKIDPRQPEARLVLDWLIDIGPSDPAIRRSAGRVLETTFDMADFERSVAEYEAAATLSPFDYQSWLDLGRVRSANGDYDLADAAYERAWRLAPHYSIVNWGYGNYLIRRGRTDEGVAMIAKAAAADSIYASAAAGTAFQLFDGDVEKVRATLGGGYAANAGLVQTLPSLERYDEAVASWVLMSADDRGDKHKEIGAKLLDALTQAGKYRLAAHAAGASIANENERPKTGTISNGGFEAPIKLRDAGLFEWKIADGAAPQISVSGTNKNSGNFSLWLTFNSFETAAFRDISQTVAVVPGAQYEFELFYRSEVRSKAMLKWQLADAVTGGAIIATDALAPVNEWTPVRVRFTMPATSDGLTIRLIREGCIGPACQMNGRIMFDDLSLKRVG
jgi:tetratricopeptide (TPR) repeat protein